MSEFKMEGNFPPSFTGISRSLQQGGDSSSSSYRKAKHSSAHSDSGSDSDSGPGTGPSYLVPAEVVGGSGGRSFSFTGERAGATLRKLCVWAGEWQLRGLKAWLTDGRSQQFGAAVGPSSELKLRRGERITSLRIQTNRSRDRVGCIRVRTELGAQRGEFRVSIGDGALGPPARAAEVGSGICVGIRGRAGEDVDSLGFVFLRPVRCCALTGVEFPTLARERPRAAAERLRSVTYVNDSDAAQAYSVDVDRTLSRSSRWVLPHRLGETFTVTVRAGIPTLQEGPDGFRFSLEEEQERARALQETEEKPLRCSFPVLVPRRSVLEVEVLAGRAAVELPFTGTLEVCCCNGSVLRFNAGGVYRGEAYSRTRTVVSERRL